MFYTGAILVSWGFPLPFDVLRGELAQYHMGFYGAHVGLVVLVRVLVGMICPLVVPPSEMAQGPRLELYLGYAPSEMVSLGGEGLGEYFCELPEGRCLLVTYCCEWDIRGWV